MARKLHESTKGGAVVSCLIFLALLLGLVRRYARRQRAFTPDQRQRILNIALDIREHLELRRPLLSPTAIIDCVTSSASTVVE
jgi:hypothetical protein